MLTGKDIHEIFKHVDARAKDWDRIGMNAQAAYDNVAGKLHQSRIVPLQGQIAGLEAQVDKLTADIKALRDLDRKIFDEQEQRIDALQSLVKEFVTFAVKWNWEPGEEAQKRRELVALAQGLLSTKEQ
jgi:hypothetical protein